MFRCIRTDAPRVTTDTDLAAVPTDADAERLVVALLSPGGIHTAFQPVVRVADGTIVGYEALARSNAAADLTPDVWLEIAERAGRRDDVELACVEAALAAGPPPDGVLLFVNVSPDVALDPRLPALCRALPRHVLEVTEHRAVDDYEPLQDSLRALRSSGSMVAVDDVGAGYASMAHVLQLGPSFIKIDRSLVQGLHSDSRRRALVEALQAFASAIGALTIAEGVETPEELRELRAAGVDLAQGYLLGRPQAPWAEVPTQAKQVLAPITPTVQLEDLEGLTRAVSEAVTTGDVCELVGQYLSRQGGLLPSVYLERGGVLRCQSRRGQWLVMDGLHPGTGITGAAFVEENEIVCEDVDADPRYRLAIPGVCSEMAVPLRASGRVVGVLNVDAVAPLLPAQRDLVRHCAELLERRLETLQLVRSTGAALNDLSRLAPILAQATSSEELTAAALAAVSELTGFDSGCVWSFAAGADAHAAPVVASTCGIDADVLATLEPDDVELLRVLVSDLTSCYSGGTDLSLAVPPTHMLRERGARGVILVPIRDGWGLTDVLALTSRTTSYVPADVVDAVENLCLLTGSRLAALRSAAALAALVATSPTV